MRARLVAILTALLLTATARSQAPVQYQVQLVQPDAIRVATREKEGKKSLWVTVRFKVNRPDGSPADDVSKDEIVVEEDRRRVRNLEIDAPGNQEPLTVVMAIDVSGSMVKNGRLDQAKRAARAFLDKLHGKANCGLILFDHEIKVREAPAGQPERIAEHRARLHKHIDAAQPGGGTAWLDATYEAVQMLRGVKGRKAVLVLTDGVDLNSKHSFKDVVVAAVAAEVRVYTLGVGEPGSNEPVTTVLVLDHSGSMAKPSDDNERITKIEALHRAASRYVELMRPGARTTLLPFSSRVPAAEAFTDDKDRLKANIQKLKPRGGTRLFDATYDAIATIDAEGAPGRRGVVVLTDGHDEGSRRRVEELIARSRDARAPLHMLALGRPHEVNELVMQRMAKDTSGSYSHATNQQKLVEIFETLSFQLHDDGIDEAALMELADVTGGKYFKARDVSRLHLIYEELAEELQTTWTVAFPSQRPSDDGTARAIDISVVRNGTRISDVASTNYQRPGVVVAEMNQAVYLLFLLVLACLLAVPPSLRRLYRFYGGT